MKSWLTATLALIAACGSGGGDALDASPPDASSPDASPADAALGTVHVKLSRDGLVLAAVPVAFQGEDGRILEVVMTDSGGEATGTMEPNGMVTFPNDFARTLETHAGLQIGDELVITDDVPADPVIGTVTAMFPGTFAGATRYVLKIACGPAAVSAELGADTVAQPITLSVSQSCVAPDQTIAVTAIAYQNGLNVVAYSAVLGLPLDGDGATDFTLPAWQSDFDPIALTGAGLDPTLFYAYAIFAPRAAAGHELLRMVEEVPLLINGSFSATLVVPHGLPRPGLALVFYFDSTNPAGVYRRFERTAPVDDTTTITAADLLPAITGVEYSGGPRPTVTWTYAAPFPETASTFLQIGEPNGSGWDVYLPAGAAVTEFHYPELPEELAASGPTSRYRFHSLLVETQDAVGRHWSGGSDY